MALPSMAQGAWAWLMAARRAATYNGPNGTETEGVAMAKGCKAQAGARRVAGNAWPAYALALLLACALALAGCAPDGAHEPAQEAAASAFSGGGAAESPLDSTFASGTDEGLPPSAADAPAWSGAPYTVVNGNEPAFTASERASAPGTEAYGDLDALGRCTEAFALVGPETLPTEERRSISSVKPTGWRSVTYDCVDGGSLYNRCHLLAHQLTGEDANWRNLITGTRYLNVEGMLPFEEAVGDYVRSTGNHVLMRARPVFSGDEPLARGVALEALSVEDEGAGVRFSVFCHNVQPGIELDYATGDSWVADTGEGNSSLGLEAQAPSGQAAEGAEVADGEAEQAFVLNTHTHRFHRPDCPSASAMKERNRQAFSGLRSALIAQGYSPCGNCKP